MGRQFSSWGCTCLMMLGQRGEPQDLSCVAGDGEVLPLLWALHAWCLWTWAARRCLQPRVRSYTWGCAQGRLPPSASKPECCPGWLSQGASAYKPVGMQLLRSSPRSRQTTLRHAALTCSLGAMMSGGSAAASSPSSQARPLSMPRTKGTRRSGLSWRNCRMSCSLPASYAGTSPSFSPPSRTS